MKYQCAGCKRVFLHPAKRITEELSLVVIDTSPQIRVANSMEKHACPYCQSLDLTEYQEPIASVKSVDIAEVDALLKQGYAVHELYARTATLIKKEAKSV